MGDNQYCDLLGEAAQVKSDSMNMPHARSIEEQIRRLTTPVAKQDILMESFTSELDGRNEQRMLLGKNFSMCKQFLKCQKSS